MGKNLLFVNVSKNTKIFILHSAEAERYGHNVFNLSDWPRPEHRSLKHIEYCINDGLEYIKNIKRIFEEKNIDYIVTQCEIMYPILDRLSNEGYPVIPIMKTPCENLVNKERFGQFCDRVGLPGPDWFTPLTVESFINYDKPIFVKPTNGTDGTIKMHRSEDKYAFFDYCRFDSVDHFMKVLQKNDYVDKFFDTQNNLSNMPKGKGVKGIKGRHIIQECIPSDVYYFFNLMIVEGQMRFLFLSRTKHKYKPKMYMLDDSHTETLTIGKHDNNHAFAKNWLGADVFEPFMEQMTKVIENAEIELAVLDVSFIPFRDTWCLQDLQLRHGGVIARVIKTEDSQKTDRFYDRIEFDDIEYDSIWEYI